MCERSINICFVSDFIISNTLKVHFKTNLFLLYNSVEFVFDVYSSTSFFVLLQGKKFRRFNRNIFWFIFVANNKNNWSTLKEIFDYTLYNFTWITFNTQWIQEKQIRTLSLIGMTSIRNGLNFESCTTIKWILQARS